MIRKIATNKINGKEISFNISNYSEINDSEYFGNDDPENENYFINNWKEKTFHEKISKREILKDWGYKIDKYFDFEMQKITVEDSNNKSFLLLNNIFNNLDGTLIYSGFYEDFYYHCSDLKNVGSYDVPLAFDNCTFFNKSDFENLNDEQFEHFVKLEIKKAIIELEDYCDKQFEEEEEAYFYFQDYKNYFEEAEEEEEETN